MEINSNLNLLDSHFKIPTEPNLLKDLLERLHNEIYLSWLKDWDKTNELRILIKILEMILESESIENFFKNDNNNINFFLNKFSKEVINNILRQSITPGEDGDYLALEVLILYTKIFLKFIQNSNYLNLYENIKEIFDGSKSFYKCPNSFSNSEIKKKKQMSAEFFNEFYLHWDRDKFYEVKEGDIVDVHVENKKGYAQQIIFNDKDVWVRGIVIKIEDDNIILKTPLDEEGKFTQVNRNSFELTQEGKMTRDYEWRISLHVGDLVDCFDRGRWYVATVIERNERTQSDNKNIINVIYKIAFRIFPKELKDWEKYRYIWPNKIIMTDSNDRFYYGDVESMDEKIPFYSKRIQKLNTMTSNLSNNQINNLNEIPLTEDLYSQFYIDELVSLVHNSKKNYVIAHQNFFNNSNCSFSYFYGLLIYKFADLNGFQILIDSINSNTPHEIINLIFGILYNSFSLLHKDFLKSLSSSLYTNCINYINNLNQNEIRNIKKETIESITKVLRFFLFLQIPIQKVNEEIEKFLLNFSLRMLKTNFLDKRISSLKTIVEILKKNQNKNYLMNLLEENKIFYEIFGVNSHIQLIKNSKELLQTLAAEDKLQDEEIEMIWKATSKGDLEGKLTILKILREISPSLKKQHLKKILDNFYQMKIKSLDIINEEINLIYDLSLIADSDDNFEIPNHQLKNCVDYFMETLIHINAYLINNQDDKDYSANTNHKYEKEKINLIIEKLIEIAKRNSKYFYYILNKCYDILQNDENNKSVISFVILQKLILNFRLNDTEKLIEIFINNFNDFSEQINISENYNQIRTQIQTRLNFINILIKNNIWTDSLQISDNSYFPHPLDFIHEILINKINTRLSQKEFYNWLKSLVGENDKNDSNVIRSPHQIKTEEKIFNFFNQNITNISNFTKEAFDSYIRIFLDINIRENKIKILKDNSFEILTKTEYLIGYENIWKILINYDNEQEVINEGIEILLKIHNKESHNIILEKCIGFINNIENKLNITKILNILNKIIIKSEIRIIPEGVKSIKSIIKDKLINLTIHSHFRRGIDYLDKEIIIKLSKNSTIWELREKIGEKVKISQDFLNIFVIKNLENNFIENRNLVLIKEEENGLTLEEANIEDEDIIKIFNNNLDQTIPHRELAISEDKIIPEVEIIFNEWYDIFSTNGKMTREDCARFVKKVTNAKDEVYSDDNRVSFMFANFDTLNEGFIPRKGFISFYEEATLKNDKRFAVWENLKNSGFRNDLKKYEENYYDRNLNKFIMPRWILSNDDNYFKIFLNLLNFENYENSQNFENNKLNKDIFEFILHLNTNETIYNQILNYDENLLNELFSLEDFNNYKLVYCLIIIQSIVEEINPELKYENQKINQIKIKWIKTFITSGGFNNMIRLMLNRILNFQQNEIEITITFHLLRIFRIIFYSFLNIKNSDKNVNFIEDINEPNVSDLIMEIINFSYKEIVEKIFTFLQNIYNFSYNNADLGNINSQLLQRNEIEDSFRILVECLIPFPPDEQLSHFVDNLIINSSKLNSISEEDQEGNILISFDSICSFGLLNEKSNIRKKFCESLVKLIKILQNSKRFELITHLFQKSYEMVNMIERNMIENKNNLYFKNSIDFFEFFANLLEIFYTISEENKIDSSNILNEDNNEIINPKEYFMKIIRILVDDIENKNNLQIDKELVIGYLKILSKVCENNNDIKKIVSDFKNSHKMLELITKNVLFKSSDNSGIIEKIKDKKFIKKEEFNDNKLKRNEDNQIKKSWYDLIKSLLKNSLENFEKFLEINLQENKNNRINEAQQHEGIAERELTKKASSISQSTYGNYEGYVGLRNLGCICYMNSMIQQLFMIPTFRYAILQIEDTEEIDENDNKNQSKIDDNFLHQLKRMFTYLEMSNREDFIPQNFCYSFKDFEGNPTNILIQQDSQEFLSRFTDKLETQIRETKFKYLLESIFLGKTASQLICEEGCGYTSIRYEDFCTLSLELTNMNTIHESLEKFIQPEKIEEYTCSHCNKKVTITKRNLISELPNVLICHFQRIFYNYEQDRNEKINSRLEFPKVLNMKNFCIEDNFKGEEREDEIYYKHDDYYEYFLVGVIVHLGSADAGHYFSLINTKREGDHSQMLLNKDDLLNENNNWLKFNDSRISHFDPKKLEEESYGGKLYEEGSASNLDSIQSAYMAVYERKLKTPIKIVIKDIEMFNLKNLVEFNEYDSFKIKKQFSLPYNYGKNEFENLQKVLFEDKMIFHDVTKHEYFYYQPFYTLLKKENKLFPQEYFIEVLEDNIQFQKLQNISDHCFNQFYEEVIIEFGNTIKNIILDNDKIEFFNKHGLRLIKLYMIFIFNSLSSFNYKEEREKIPLLRLAAEKLIEIIDVVSDSNLINLVFKFYLENKRKLLECIFNDNVSINEIHTNLLYEIIKRGNKIENKEFIFKIIDFIRGLFPAKIHNRNINKLMTIYTFFKNIANISEDIMIYLANREFIYTFITFLLGRESPCYKDSVKIEDKNWDVMRTTPTNFDDLLFLIFQIYTNYKESLTTNNENIKLSERDKKCIQSMNFLRLIYKNNQRLFSDFISFMSINEGYYTRLSCIEITRFIDDISFIENNELCNLFQSIRKLLLINDEYQMFRFGIILGYPQIMIEDCHFNFSKNLQNSKTIPTFPIFGYHLMTDFNSKIYEFKGLVNYRTTCSFIRKLMQIKNREKITIENFLMILNASIENQSLLKYIRYLPSEEPYFEDFTQWGVALIHHYTNKTENVTYLNMLKGIVEKINPILGNVINDNEILKNFKGFVGKYLHKDIKREEFQIVYKTENVFIMQINYYTNTVQYDKDLDFSKSLSNKPEFIEENLEIDQQNNLITSENVIVVNMSTKPPQEREWIKKIIPVLSHGKKIIVQNPFKVEESNFNLIRFVAFNNSPREASIHLSVKRAAIHNPINEFISTAVNFSNITTTLMPYMIKNVLTLTKINPNLKWSFESDKGLSLNFENTKIDLVESLSNQINIPTKPYLLNEYPSMGTRLSNVNIKDVNIKTLNIPRHEDEFEDKIKH